MLPTLFIQLLRPFSQYSDDIDARFVKAIVTPEFRTTSVKFDTTAIKMASYFSTYKDFPEETATSLLADEYLLSKATEAIESDQEFNELMEHALAEENEKKSAQIEQAKTQISIMSGRLDQVSKSENDLRNKLEKLSAETALVLERDNTTKSEIEKLQHQADEAHQRSLNAERRLEKFSCIASWSVPVCVLLAAALCSYLLRIQWTSKSNLELVLFVLASSLLVTGSLGVPLRRNLRERASWFLGCFTFVTTALGLWALIEVKIEPHNSKKQDNSAKTKATGAP